MFEIMQHAPALTPARFPCDQLDVNDAFDVTASLKKSARNALHRYLLHYQGLMLTCVTRTQPDGTLRIQRTA